MSLKKALGWKAVKEFLKGETDGKSAIGVLQEKWEKE
jgi:hypothetical protein